MKNILVILDAGHGGMINGVYTTAPAKMFKHSDGTTAYEGVINRQIKNELAMLLDHNGIAWDDVAPGNEDTSLETRTDKANEIYSIKKDTHLVLYLSIHSNAGGGTGFEVWTSVGQTLSDKYGELCSQQIKKDFPSFKFRAGTEDGDLDKEAQFWVLRKTDCPAILVEALFFDNFEDWKIQRTPKYISDMAHCLLSFIKQLKTDIC
jgi:N-acetylmuramoyl-L-alanine amidase